MATLNYLAPPTPPQEEPDVPYDMHPIDHARYIVACQQRKQAFADARAEWREAVSIMNQHKARVAELRAKMDNTRALPPPNAPYVKLLDAGVFMDIPEGE